MRADPPPGYRWSPAATFYAPARTVASSATECYGCGFSETEHGPERQCPTLIVEDIPF